MQPPLNDKRALLLGEPGVLRDSLRGALEQQGASVTCATQDCDADECSVDLLVQISNDAGGHAGAPRRLERAAAAMAERGFGRVIQLVFTQETQAAQNAAQAHLHTAQWRSITSTCARRHAGRGVTINLVELALVEGCNDQALLAAELLRHTPLGRATMLSEVAAAVVFLAAAQAAYMTGVCLPLCGGLGLGLYPEQLR